MKKKLLGVSLIVVIVISTIMTGLNPIYVQAASKEAKAAKAYKTFLEKQSSNASFTVFDLDGDGVKELYFTKDDYKLFVYIYKNGKVQKLNVVSTKNPFHYISDGNALIKAGIYVNRKQHTIVADSWSNGGNMFGVYKISGSKLRQIRFYEEGWSGLPAKDKVCYYYDCLKKKKVNLKLSTYYKQQAVYEKTLVSLRKNSKTNRSKIK